MNIQLDGATLLLFNAPWRWSTSLPLLAPQVNFNVRRRSRGFRLFRLGAAIMDPIIAACITGGLGLLTGLLVGYKDEIKNFLARGSRPVKGWWTGKGHDIDIPKLLKYQLKQSYQLTASLKQAGKQVTGQITSISDATYHLTFKGSLRGNTLLGEYKNEKDQIDDWGVVLLELDGTGKQLDGFFLGMRTRGSGLVFARVELRRA